jgi:hypothetical protein
VGLGKAGQGRDRAWLGAAGPGGARSGLARYGEVCEKLRRHCGEKGLAHAMILVSKKLRRKNLVSKIFLSRKRNAYRHSK